MNHAVIQCDSDGVVLLDKGSLNKTRLNKVIIFFFIYTMYRLLYTYLLYYNIFYVFLEKFEKRRCLFS